MKYLAYLILSVCSCSGTTNITTKQVDLPSAHPPQIAALHLSQFNWRIINEQDLKNLTITATKSPGTHILLYTLDNKNYMIFDEDLLELQRYISEQNEVIQFYQQLEDSKIGNLKQK